MIRTRIPAAPIALMLFAALYFAEALFTAATR
jgi:hypothetical protein